ncbi:MAG: tRNA pseudouridine38-40 synthase [bacterium]|jgi:tRNA pseudouridine38-40 synthase
MKAMKRIKLKLQFDGHLYLGWQIQPEGQSTVQGRLNNALKKIYKIDVKTIGSGRTDSGVHSLSHFVCYNEPFSIPLKSIVLALNTKLPPDIRVMDAEQVDIDFRPTNDAVSREYRYLFSNEKIPSPFQANYISNISYSLDFELMRDASKSFVGKHDFEDFYCVGSDPTSSIREIFEIELLTCPADIHGIFPKHYYFRIVGSGFLKQMVRLIVGTLWSVGREKVSIIDVEDALKNPKGKHLSPVAPAEGLFKYNVEYIEP